MHGVDRPTGRAGAKSGAAGVLRDELEGGRWHFVAARRLQHYPDMLAPRSKSPRP